MANDMLLRKKKDPALHQMGFKFPLGLYRVGFESKQGLSLH